MDGKRGRSTVRFCLDRTIRNEDCHENFPHSSVKYLRLWGLNYRPVLANMIVKQTRAKKTFNFNKCWLASEELRRVIMEGWNSSNLPTDAYIIDHISSCRRALSQWRRENDINSEEKVEDLKEKIESLYSNENSTSEDIVDALKNLTKALKMEELFWKQKIAEYFLAM